VDDRLREFEAAFAALASERERLQRVFEQLQDTHLRLKLMCKALREAIDHREPSPDPDVPPVTHH